MIGEATPRGVGTQGGAQSWEAWFAPFFELIHQRREIKAFSYINWNWAERPPWTTWGDARIEANTAITARYRAELSRDLYVPSPTDAAHKANLASDKSE